MGSEMILKAIEKFNKTSSSLPLKKVKIAFYGLAFKATSDDCEKVRQLRFETFCN